MGTPARAAALAIFASGLALVSACEIQKVVAPALTGPSELGTSITLFANPDVLSLDGRSQSQIVIQARGTNGQPLRDLPVRAEIFIGGVLADIGRLSSRTVVTGSDGRATLTYTAPTSVEPSEAADPGTGQSVLTVVSILVTPSGTDFANALARRVDIRLVPVGVILPPNSTPVPAFTFTPQPAQEGVPVRFDASTSRDDGVIVSYSWDFGDGNTASGVQVTHTFRAAGTFNVTLTVVDDRGLRASTTQAIPVGASANPTASFTVSPTNPTPLETVFFNASASQAAAGRQIVSYSWTFGDGNTASGVIVQNRFSTPGNYNVTLTVRDDIGRTGTASQAVVVGTATRPTASFVFSPQAPVVGQFVIFDGTPSTAPAGRTIVRWDWQMGDGTVKFGPRVDHIYSVAGTGNVVLTVTDSAGQTGTTTQTITISPASSQNPTAAFVASPDPASVNQPVVVDATSSSAQGGATIVSYEWNWGDTTAVEMVTQPTHSHTYTRTGSFTITLTVVDSLGRRGTVSRTISVE